MGTAKLNPPANIVTIGGLDNSKSYYVLVSARNAGGDSGWRFSPVSGPYGSTPTPGAALESTPTPTPTPQAPPATPTSVSLTRADGTLTATWPAAARAATYHVTYTSNNGASWSLAALNHTATSVTVSGVDNAKTYFVAVRARNSLGASGWRVSGSIGPHRPGATPTPTPPIQTSN